METSIDSPTTAPKKRLTRNPATDPKGYARSRISNHRDLLHDIDGRSLIARRYRDITNQIIVDRGGIDNCSESRIQLIRRFAAAAVLAEQMEAQLVRGEPIDIVQHALLCSTLTRLTNRIGCDRVAKNITPTLDEYLKSKTEIEAAE
jgi:hypothetical protein